MITYEPLWKTLNERDMSTYDLIFKHGLSANTIHRMKVGKAITTTTLNELCFILHCAVADIIEYRESEDD
ncbi:MAG: helix-turn-helix domain-containing protein [Clostridia bacterium]|nr:helix-turn-helix domain-containing protein [Clostridia bacterium]